MIDKTVEKIKGRPKIDWDFHYFDDVDLKKLDQLKTKQLKKIQSLNDKISKIDLLIKDVQKLISKHNASKKPILKQLSIVEDNLNSISRAIEQKSKIYTKNDDCITLLSNKSAVRGKISYFGKELWCYVGSKKKYGLVHKRKKIGRMSRSELCDEFRNKVKTKIETSWIVNDSF